MTDALKKEAEKYLKQKLEERKDKFVFELPEVYIEDVKEAYLASAKPREKQIEELEQENAELKKQQFSLRNERNTFLAQNEQYEKDLIDFNENLTNAIEILKKYHNECPSKYSFEDIDDMAEQFLSEVENEKHQRKEV